MFVSALIYHFCFSITLLHFDGVMRRPRPETRVAARRPPALPHPALPRVPRSPRVVGI